MLLIDDVTSGVTRKAITRLARISPGKTFVFWQPARKCMQSYHDYASFCPAKHDIYSVLSTEGGLNVNISHIVYTNDFFMVINFWSKYLRYDTHSVKDFLCIAEQNAQKKCIGCCSKIIICYSTLELIMRKTFQSKYFAMQNC